MIRLKAICLFFVLALGSGCASSGTITRTPNILGLVFGQDIETESEKKINEAYAAAIVGEARIRQGKGKVHESTAEAIKDPAKVTAKQLRAYAEIMAATGGGQNQDSTYNGGPNTSYGVYGGKSAYQRLRCQFRGRGC